MPPQLVYAKRVEGDERKDVRLAWLDSSDGCQEERHVRRKAKRSFRPVWPLRRDPRGHEQRVGRTGQSKEGDQLGDGRSKKSSMLTSAVAMN
jgi:hypothetical protein